LQVEVATGRLRGILTPAGVATDEFLDQLQLPGFIKCAQPAISHVLIL
jgi:hypothetical protein